jgi:hypothetical protein
MDLGSTQIVEIVTNYFFIMISLHNLRKQGNRKKITKNFQIPDPLSYHRFFAGTLAKCTGLCTPYNCRFKA